MRIHGKPENFNSDQGSQFTGVLKREETTISMDGRGRAFDNIFVERLWRNVEHEDVYLKGYATIGEFIAGLAEKFSFLTVSVRISRWGKRRPLSCIKPRWEAVW